MSQVAALQPQSDGLLVEIAASLLGDEQVPAIEVIHLEAKCGTEREDGGSNVLIGTTNADSQLGVEAGHGSNESTTEAHDMELEDQAQAEAGVTKQKDEVMTEVDSTELHEEKGKVLNEIVDGNGLEDGEEQASSGMMAKECGFEAEDMVVSEVGEENEADSNETTVEMVNTELHVEERQGLNQKTTEKCTAERKFYRSLVFTVDTIEAPKEEDCLVDREHIAFLSGSIPLQSIDSMALLLNHIYQNVVRMEASSSSKTTFSKDLKHLLDGLSCMKKDEYPMPRELTDLFSREPSPSLLEALIVLLFAAKSQGKLDGIGDDDDTVISQESKFLEASKGTQEGCKRQSTDVNGGHISPTPPTEATSETTETTRGSLRFDIQDASDVSPVLGIPHIDICITHPDLQVVTPPTDCNSSLGSMDGAKSVDLTAFRQISTAREELLFPPLSTGSEMFDIDLVHAVGGAFSAKPGAEQELKSTDQVQVTISAPVLEASSEEESYDETTNYNKALRTIDTIRMNLQDENEKKSNHGVKTRAVTWKDNKAPKDCDDSTVDCSLDSIGITDDEASQESEESKGSGLFNCAFDSMLDMVLGPPCLPYCSDSSISSMESEE